MPVSFNSNSKLKLTRFPLKLELVLFHQSILQFPLALLVWIPHKSIFSTLLTFQQRLWRVRLKSPKISESVQWERRSKHQKLHFWKSSTSGHSNMEWRLLQFMTMEPSSHKKSLALIQLHFWHLSNQVSRTWSVYHLKLDTQLRLQFHWSLETLSKTLLLYHSSPGKIFNNFRFKIPELSLL